MKSQVLSCRWLLHFLLSLCCVNGWSNFSSTQILHGVFAHNGTCQTEQIITILSPDFPTASYISLVVSDILPLLSHFLPWDRGVISTPDILPMIIKTIYWPTHLVGVPFDKNK